MGGNLAELVHPPVDGAVLGAVKIMKAVDDFKRFLGRGRIVQIDERAPVHLPAENRKVFADFLDVQTLSHDHFPSPGFKTIFLICSRTGASTRSRSHSGRILFKSSSAKPQVKIVFAAFLSRPR